VWLRDTQVRLSTGVLQWNCVHYRQQFPLPDPPVNSGRNLPRGISCCEAGSPTAALRVPPGVGGASFVALALSFGSLASATPAWPAKFTLWREGEIRRPPMIRSASRCPAGPYKSAACFHRWGPAKRAEGSFAPSHSLSSRWGVSPRNPLSGNPLPAPCSIPGASRVDPLEPASASGQWVRRRRPWCCRT
jgi:hypothetical protein